MDERNVFFSLLQHGSVSERGSILNEVGAENPTLRNRIKNWLQIHDSFDDWVSSNSAEDARTTDCLPPEFLFPSQYPGSLGRLEHYEVLRVVGNDPTGVLLEAFDTHLDRIVTIKVLSAQRRQHLEARRQFLAETRALATVLHPNITRVLDVGEQCNTPYAVWECVESRSLSHWIAHNGSFTVEQIKQIGLQTAEGLAAIHSVGLIHRAINPSSIFLCGSREFVKISTLGLAGGEDAYHVNHGKFVASRFTSFEQEQGLQIDHRADLFNLGAVLYTMAASQSASQNTTLADLTQEICALAPRPIEQVAPQIPEWVAETISRLLAADPSDRYQSAQDVVNVFEDRQLQERATQSAPIAQRKYPRIWRHCLRILAFLATAGFSIGFYIVLFTHGGVISRFQGVGNLVVQTDDPKSLFVLEGKARNNDPIYFIERGSFSFPLLARDLTLSGVKNGVKVFEEKFHMKPWRGDKEFVFHAKMDGLDSRLNPNREAARWILLRGGAIRQYWLDGELKDEPIRYANQIPAGDLLLISVRLDRLTPADTEAVCAALAGCTGLTELVVENSELSGESLRHFAKISTLNILHLSNLFDVSEEQFLPLAKLPELQELGLSYSDCPAQFCAAVGQMPHLRVLSICDTPCTDEMLNELTNLESLESLTIHSRFVTDAAVDLFTGLPSLVHLGIRSPQLTDVIWERLAQIEQLESLEIGGFPTANDNDLNCQGILALQALPELDLLELAQVDVADDSVEEIKVLARTQELRLQGCSLDGTQIDSKPTELQTFLQPATMNR